jgi:methylisocitrate lyase
VSDSAGSRFRLALAEEKPLQIVGTINAYAALLAERAGFRAIYLSGAGVANASFGLPDLGLTHPGDVLEDARRITAATELPLIVDLDAGFGGELVIERLVRDLVRGGAAAAHIEDQVEQKRCGHRPNKSLVSPAEMVMRLSAAVDARSDDAFMIIARTDALAGEGLAGLIDRAGAYAAAGADALFVEAITEIDLYRQVTAQVELPVLANMTEFGMTPLYTLDELRAVGIAMALYPLTVFRAMSGAAIHVLRALREHGTQAGQLNAMQTREDLYALLNYYAYEQRLDQVQLDKSKQQAEE